MYTKIDAIMWVDDKFKTLSDDGKLVFAYVLTTPHRNMIGLYLLPIPYAAYDLNWTSQRVEKGFRELLDKGLVKYNFDINILYIKNYLKFNPIENPNQAKGALSSLSTILVSDFESDLYEYLITLDKPFLKGLLERLHKRLCKQEEGEGKEEVKETEEETGKGEEATIPPCPYEDIRISFNKICSSLSQVQTLSQSRKDKIKVRWSELKTLKAFEEIFTKVETTPFCKGVNDRGWKVTFDWLMENDKHYLRVLEGNYENKTKEWRVK